MLVLDCPVTSVVLGVHLGVHPEVQDPQTSAYYFQTFEGSDKEIEHIVGGCCILLDYSIVDRQRASFDPRLDPGGLHTCPVASYQAWHPGAGS